MGELYVSNEALGRGVNSTESREENIDVWSGYLVASRIVDSNRETARTYPGSYPPGSVDLDIKSAP